MLALQCLAAIALSHAELSDFGAAEPDPTERGLDRVGITRPPGLRVEVLAADKQKRSHGRELVSNRYLRMRGSMATQALRLQLH